jgi:hypothetical protein
MDDIFDDHKNLYEKPNKFILIIKTIGLISDFISAQ